MNCALLFFSCFFIQTFIISEAKLVEKVQLAPVYKTKDHVDNKYIVVFKGNAAIGGKKKTIADLLSRRDGINEIHHEYSLINGFAATITSSSLQMLRRNKDVKFIEQDSIMHAYQDKCIDQANAEWCLERIADVKNEQRKYVYHKGAGNNVTVYVIDTGVNVKHPDFQGRARQCANFVRYESGEDINGHGTGVASLVAGARAGTAKNANICAIKVLNSRGSGSTSDIIAGINWVTKQNEIGIINLSLGGGISKATNDAVNKAADKGHFVVCAAGNEAQDACNVSPASAEKAFTVAASDENNNLASFSNYGSCVDVIAPGVNCLQASASNGQFKKSSGTSFSAPLTAGVAAALKSRNSRVKSEDIRKQLLANGARNEIKNVKRSVNIFLQNKCA